MVSLMVPWWFLQKHKQAHWLRFPLEWLVFGAGRGPQTKQKFLVHGTHLPLGVSWLCFQGFHDPSLDSKWKRLFFFSLSQCSIEYLMFPSVLFCLRRSRVLPPYYSMLNMLCREARFQHLMQIFSGEKWMAQSHLLRIAQDLSFLWKVAKK